MNFCNQLSQEGCDIINQSLLKLSWLFKCPVALSEQISTIIFEMPNYGSSRQLYKMVLNLQYSNYKGRDFRC